MEIFSWLKLIQHNNNISEPVQEVAVREQSVSVKDHVQTVCLQSEPVQSEQYLLVRDGEDKYQIKLNKLPLVIGRGKTYDSYVFTDKAISAKHARIEKTGRIYTITDLSSTNGTQINGSSPIRSGNATSIRHGDVIKVGRTELYFISKIAT